MGPCQLGRHLPAHYLGSRPGCSALGASYDADTRRYTVPGSWLPLALFMAIFACKFAVGMISALAPDLLQSLSAAIGISALYGLFSGVLNARAWRLLKLAYTA